MTNYHAKNTLPWVEPWAHRDPSASASWVLVLKAWWSPLYGDQMYQSCDDSDEDFFETPQSTRMRMLVNQTAPWLRLLFIKSSRSLFHFFPLLSTSSPCQNLGHRLRVTKPLYLYFPVWSHWLNLLSLNFVSLIWMNCCPSIMSCNY